MKKAAGESLLIARLREADAALSTASECSMTSFAPLAELALRTLAEAEPGSFSGLDAAARHDLAYARSLSPAQRLAALNDMLLLAEAFGLPPVSHEPIAIHGELLL